ncbi:MAG: hypothetical protein ACYCWW_14395 [Deltaproteobacteria bacterium]
MDLAIDAPGASARQWLDLLELLDDAPTLLSIDAVRPLPYFSNPANPR